MPLKEFQCPDLERIPTAECLARCRMNLRCCSLPSLSLMARVRDKQEPGWWTATDLLNGVRATILQRHVDYAEAPWLDLAWSCFGTKSHNLREQEDMRIGHLCNEAIRNERLHIVGHPDDVYQLGGRDPLTSSAYGIVDHKAVGGFSIQKALGYFKEKGGVRREAPDLGTYGMQLNIYRLLVEEAGFTPVVELWIEYLFRDGTPRNRSITGLDRAIYMVPVPLMEVNEVVAFVGYKTTLLNRAERAWLTDGPEKPSFRSPDFDCTPAETWQGKRCESYCPVRDVCSQRAEGRTGK